MENVKQISGNAILERMNMNRISVIVPIFNGEKYVRNCIRMLLLQSEYIYEIILVNDGSCDKTEEIISQFLPNEKINYIFQENKGVSEARNMGLCHAQGEWIVFCDVDDRIIDGYFREISTIIEKEQMDLLCFARDTVGIEDYSNNIYNLNKRTAFLSILGEGDLIDSQDYLMMAVWSKAFRKSVLTDYKILFDKRLSFGEDTLFMLDCVNKCKRIDCIHRGYYSYIQNENSACKKGGKESDYTGFKVLVERVESVLFDFIGMEIDEHFIEVRNRFIYRMGEYSIGRYRRGSVDRQAKERKCRIRDMCKIMMKYSRGVSLKKIVKNQMIKIFTGLYLKYVGS